MELVAALPFWALTYVLGAIPFGLVLTTLYGGTVDIRKTGSGNIGATNVARVYGWRLAVATVLLDAAKGALPTLVAAWIWPDWSPWWPALVGFTAFVAHCSSVFLEFRGGKGVATAAGVTLVLLPLPALVALGVWIGVLRLTGRSSVAALVAAFVLLGLTAFFAIDRALVVAAFACGIVVTHASNIRRLMAGEEHQVVRPVRVGRAEGPSPVELLEQGIVPEAPAEPVWRDEPVQKGPSASSTAAEMRDA